MKDEESHPCLCGHTGSPTISSESSKGRKHVGQILRCRALQSRSNMPEVKSLFAREKEAMQAVKIPPRHPRHGGTYMTVNQNQPSNVSIMRSRPRRAQLPELMPQKPKTKLIVSPADFCSIEAAFSYHPYSSFQATMKI